MRAGGLINWIVRMRWREWEVTTVNRKRRVEGVEETEGWRAGGGRGANIRTAPLTLCRSFLIELIKMNLNL